MEQHYVCSYCSKECKNNNSLINHERLCKHNPSYDSQKYQCTYCDRRFARIDRLHVHEYSCVNNPNRQPSKVAWNRGLTKETCEITRRKAEDFSRKVKLLGNVGAAGLKGELNPSKRPEVKAKVSAKMRGNHYNDPNKTGRGKKGWYKGFFCSSTYELAFVIYCLDHDIKIERYAGYYDYVYNEEAHRYYPDFIIDNCIYEIKGYYTDEVKAKTEAVTDREIKVLYRDDLKEVFDYILSVYNKKVDKNIQDLYE